MADKITLSEFWDKVNSADWFYEMSDDGAVWQKGKEAFGVLCALAKQSPEHQEIYDAFNFHHYSGEAFGSEKKLKPERPGD